MTGRQFHERAAKAAKRATKKQAQKKGKKS